MAYRENHYDQNMAYLLCRIDVKNREEEILDANGKCLELFECGSLAELKSYCEDYIYNAIYEDDKPRVNHKKDECVSNEHFIMQHSLFRIVTKNGNVKWVDAYVNLNDMVSQGLVYHMFIDDISDKLANISVDSGVEKAIQEYKINYDSSHQMNKLIDLLTEEYYGIFRLDLTSGLVIPVRYSSVLGNEPDNLGAEAIDSMDSLKEYLVYGMDDDEAKRITEALQVENIRISLWDEGKCTQTYRWRDYSGDRFFSLNFIGVDNPPYDHVVVGITDITEVKRIEIENRKNSRIVEALSDDYTAVFYVDVERETVRLYRAEDDVKKRFGHLLEGQASFDDMVKAYINREAYIKKDDDAYKYLNYEKLRDDVNKKGIVTFNYTRILNGEKRQYRLKAVKIEENGEYKGIVLGFRDVDDEYRKDLETQLILRAALEEAKHASSSKSNFLFNMSHDIRTPMNAILGFVSLAQNEMDNPDKLTDYLSKIEKSGKHLLGLINDVLDMARIESGKVELNESVLDLRTHYNETVDMFKIDMDKKNITFNHSLEIIDDVVKADSLRTKQIVLNLIGNALKYTKEGGTIWFEIKQRNPAQNGYAIYEIHVRDTGIGMSEEFQKHLFDLFERENRSSVTGVQGTGLGLAITKRLVELMNGEVSCESTLGKGTEFICSIRLKVANADSIIEDEEELDLSALKGKKVLLVEDNDLNREIAKSVLEEVGMIVEEATDGTIAVEILGKKKSTTYDVVLMDIQMPYMDGYKATRIIRNAEVRTKGHVPIIAMTANAFEEDKKKAFEAGMDAHIAKPVEIKELYKELIRLS